MSTSANAVEKPKSKSSPSRQQIERMVRAKGYRLMKAGDYSIPLEVLELQTDLDRCDQLLALLDKLDPRSVTDFTIHNDSSFAQSMIDSTRILVFSWRRQVRRRMQAFQV